MLDGIGRSSLAGPSALPRVKMGSRPLTDDSLVNCKLDRLDQIKLKGEIYDTAKRHQIPDLYRNCHGEKWQDKSISSITLWRRARFWTSVRRFPRFWQRGAECRGHPALTFSAFTPGEELLQLR